MIRREGDDEVWSAPPAEAGLSPRQWARMIPLTRLDGSQIYVNAELIEMLEETPDTVLSLTTGRKLVVKERAEEVSERILAYHRRVRGAERELTVRTG
ncbi:MAG: hypothetical protein KatS3mg061_2907 [Dehalococcoidia bacterium]|nr:MAG: hypothetical protein KatS3mg061_2907 [Dehalococcoidia bacterium]